jgi:ABC-type glycerol-3-phosphate transport system substrate-binding protein
MTCSMTRNRFRITAGVLGIGALVLAGCSSSPSSSAPAASASKVTLVVYSAQEPDGGAGREPADQENAALVRGQSASLNRT